MTITWTQKIRVLILKNLCDHSGEATRKTIIEIRPEKKINHSDIPIWGAKGELIIKWGRKLKNKGNAIYPI